MRELIIEFDIDAEIVISKKKKIDFIGNWEIKYEEGIMVANN